MENQLDLFGEDTFKRRYSLERVENNQGNLRHYILNILGENFIFDERGLLFFKNKFDHHSICIHNEYLARNSEGKIEYFHREFKKYVLGGISSGYDVHHKNQKKNDNRNSNLQVMPEGEHRSGHDQKIQEKIDKAKEKYLARGERMQKKYEERGEKMRERYRKRGERMGRDSVNGKILKFHFIG